jgi:hypothetical protein
MPTLNFTHSNIERHAKKQKTEPNAQTETQTAFRTQTENQNSHAEKFFPDSY